MCENTGRQTMPHGGPPAIPPFDSDGSLWFHPLSDDELQKEMLDEKYEGGAFGCDDEDDYGEKYDKCVYCGYPILPDEERLRVLSTGDAIHRRCWNDYAEDYIGDLCTNE